MPKKGKVSKLWMHSLLCSVTLEQSRVLSGLSPPLQISHSVVPKPHLSVAKLRFWGFSMHSGGTQGIRSTRTEGEEKERRYSEVNMEFKQEITLLVM